MSTPAEMPAARKVGKPIRKVTQNPTEADDTAGPMEPVVVEDPQIDVVPANIDHRQLFADMKFMNEKVTIILHQTQDLSEVGVPVGVQGKRVYIVPGVPTKIPRTHVAQLLKARPDFVNHRSDDPGVREAHLNRMYRQSTSRYNFDVIEDTAQGAEWLRALRSKHMRR